MPTSPMELALKAGLGSVRRMAGVAVTVTRGATTITIARAIQGQTQKVPLVPDSEATVDAADWLISVSDYTLGTPAIGDIITRRIDSTDYVYTVESPSIGLEPWDWSDTAKTQYRIHSRKDGAAAFDVTTPNGFDVSGNEMRYG